MSTARGSRGARGAASRGAPGRGASRGGKATDGGSATCTINVVALKHEFSGILDYTIEVKLSNEGADAFRNLNNLIEAHLDRKAGGNLKKRIREHIEEKWGRYTFAWDEAAVLFALPGKGDDFQDFQLDVANKDVDVRIRQNRDSKDVSTQANRAFVMQQIFTAATKSYADATGGTIDRRRFVVSDTDESALGKVCRSTMDPKTFPGKDAAKDRFTKTLQTIRGNGPKPAFILTRAFTVSAVDFQDQPALEILPASVIRIPNRMNLVDFLNQDTRALRGNAPRGSKGPGSPAFPKDMFEGNIDLMKTLEVERDLSKYAKDNKRLQGFGKIKGMSKTTAKTNRFTTKDGEEVTVQAYFKKQHGITLKYPDLPLVEVEFRGRKDLFPMEVLDITPQNVNCFGNLMQSHSTTLCRLMPGQVRVLATMFARTLFTHEAPSSLLKTWNITPGGTGPPVNLLTLPTYKCETPVVHLKGKKPQLRGNAWNLADVQVFQPYSQKGGKLLAIDLATEGPSRFQKALCEITASMKKAGVVINYEPKAGFKNDILPLFENADYAELTAIKKEVDSVQCRARVLKFVRDKVDALIKKAGKSGAWSGLFSGAIVAVAGSGPVEARWNEDTYMPVKMMFEGDEKIPTQFIRKGKTPFLEDRSVDQRNVDMHCSKLCLGINTKFSLNYNHKVTSKALDKLGPKTLVIGGDLAHGFTKTQTAGKAVESGYSVAALVGSRMNSTFMRYSHTAEVQARRATETDIMSDPGVLFGRLLDRLKAGNDIEEIVYLRDGVDWGSHHSIISDEVSAFERVLKERGVNKVKISVVCLMKRHKVRMVPSGDVSHDAAVAPGTSVGFDVLQLRKEEPSFYFLGHATVGVGTAVPCRCVLLRNDHGFTVQAWSDLCNSFAVMNQVVTLGVSLPTPAYYAHRACDRAAAYLGALVRPKEDYSIGFLNDAVGRMMSSTPDHCYL